MKIYNNVKDAKALERNAQKAIELSRVVKQVSTNELNDEKKESGPVSIPQAEKENETKASKKAKRRKN